MDDYVKVWEERCYPDGIPDSLPKKLEQSRRVPSYKAIALCILKNDFNLYGIGFSRRESHLTRMLMNKK